MKSPANSWWGIKGCQQLWEWVLEWILQPQSILQMTGWRVHWNLVEDLEPEPPAKPLSDSDPQKLLDNRCLLFCAAKFWGNSLWQWIILDDTLFHYTIDVSWVYLLNEWFKLISLFWVQLLGGLKLRTSCKGTYLVRGGARIPAQSTWSDTREPGAVCVSISWLHPESALVMGLGSLGGLRPSSMPSTY